MIIAVDIVTLWGFCAYAGRENLGTSAALHERLMKK